MSPKKCFNFCKPQRWEHDRFQNSLGLICGYMVALGSNSLIPQLKTASHTAALMNDRNNFVNCITLLIAQSKLSDIQKCLLFFQRLLLELAFKKSGSLLMRAITIFCLYVLPCRLLTQKLTMSMQARQAQGQEIAYKYNCCRDLTWFNQAKGIFFHK